MLLKCSSIIMLSYVVCKPMGIHGYMNIWRVWIWRAIHAHGYFRGRGTVRLMDMDLDLVLQYPSKPAPLPSLHPTLMIPQCIAKQPLLCPVIKVVRPDHGLRCRGSLLFLEKY
jgi:hypothetical protein